MASHNVFDWDAIRVRLILKPGTAHEFFYYSIKEVAEDLIKELNVGRDISLHTLLRDCRSMLEETKDMMYTSPPTLVESRERFFWVTMEVIKKRMTEDCLLEHAEDFEVVPSASDIAKSMKDEWDVVSPQDVAGSKRGKKRAAKRG
ncbi:hypothetical protein QBC40DRAFT_300365 [Triangularia verruculosa]|uniref:Uncharacterized protein n=1 Tax=Triangularia verruculosa TaxID=2587418 RepID=A0AAN6X993_9PEZI|nr:hypothetical protein QBC40DRAFT_300365 [Triangularia verruculosa]